MKKCQLILFFLLVGFVSYAQSVDEIIDKHIKAMGGKEYLESLKTLQINMDAETPMGLIHLKHYTHKELGHREDVQIMGQDLIVLVLKDKVYANNPFKGQTKLEELDPLRAKKYSHKNDIRGDLYDYKSKGIVIDYVGTEKVNNEDCDVLNVNYGNENSQKTFISQKTGYILQVNSNEETENGIQESVINFSNYTKSKHGYIYPEVIATEMGKAKVTKILVNEPLDKKLFDINQK